MKMHVICVVALVFFVQTRNSMVIETLENGEQLLHYGFKTENGQTRTEDLRYNATTNEVTKHDDDSVEKSRKDPTAMKPVEYRGGYSFISADGYKYTVLYKANKNGFQPYVTAHKIRDDKV